MFSVIASYIHSPTICLCMFLRITAPIFKGRAKLMAACVSVVIICKHTVNLSYSVSWFNAALVGASSLQTGKQTVKMNLNLQNKPDCVCVKLPSVVPPWTQLLLSQHLLHFLTCYTNTRGHGFLNVISRYLHHGLIREKMQGCWPFSLSTK